MVIQKHEPEPLINLLTHVISRHGFEVIYLHDIVGPCSLSVWVLECWKLFSGILRLQIAKNPKYIQVSGLHIKISSILGPKLRGSKAQQYRGDKLH